MTFTERPPCFYAYASAQWEKMQNMSNEENEARKSHIGRNQTLLLYSFIKIKKTG